MTAAKYWDKVLKKWVIVPQGLARSTADALYVNITGDTMTGPLIITDQGFGNFGLDVVNLYVRNDLTVDDDLTLDGGGWLTVNGAGTGGFYVEGGFEIYIDGPSRAVGFWRKSGASYQPLIASQSYEPVTKAAADQWMAAHLAAADPHPTYAKDADLAAHVAAADPHPAYATDADLAAHVAAADPHPQYATDTDLSNHAAAANPHPVYLTQPEGDALYAAVGHTHPSTDQFVWVYDTPETMADPGSNKLRTNTASGTPAEFIAFSALPVSGVDVGNLMRSLTTGDLIYFQQADVAANWGRYEITGPPTDNGSWFQVPVLGIGTSGAAIGKNKEVLIRFTYGGAGGGGTVALRSTVSATAPSSPKPGDFWTKTPAPVVLHVWDGAAWQAT